MAWVRIVVALYALLNIGGGIEGYLSPAHSVKSIIAGVIIGVLLFGGLAFSISNPKAGYIVCGVIALADLGFFGQSLAKKFSVWPAGTMAVGAIIVIVSCALAAFGGKAAS
jgi:uncharacterized membrane protein (UPF0136 family)